MEAAGEKIAKANADVRRDGQDTKRRTAEIESCSGSGRMPNAGCSPEMRGLTAKKGSSNVCNLCCMRIL